MTEQNIENEKPIEGCGPCETYKAFNDFCVKLGRAPLAKRVDLPEGDITVKMGDQACGIFANQVEGGTMTPDAYFKTLVEVYGMENVRMAALEYLDTPDAKQKRPKNEETAGTPPSGQGVPTPAETVENSGQNSDVRALDDPAEKTAEQTDGGSQTPTRGDEND